MMKKIPILLVLLFLIIQGFSQNRTISGKVVDVNGIGLPGATVQLKGTSQGLLTDIDGKYSISIPSSGNILVFSYVGYITQEIATAGNTTIDVVLMESIQNLDQVMVVGYGVQKKSLVTGAISKMEAKDIGNVHVARIDQALQGKTSGVFIAQTSGSPGSPMSVKIRGNSSNGKNDPLYIVDGIKTNGIDFLSPNDIESIEILKDAASSAIYGSEGGNGVIIITTKRATKGSSEVSYNYYHGIQSVSNYVQMMNGTEYIDYIRQAYVSEFALDPTMPKYINQMKIYAKWDSTNANTNWMNNIINTAPVDEHNISFSSGNEKGQMFLSGTYYSQDGIIGGAKNNYTRYNFNFNGDTKIKEWLTVGARVSYTHSKRNNLNESSEFGGIVSNAMLFDPTVPVTYNDESELPSNLQASTTDPGATARHNALVKDDNGKYFHLSNTTLGEAVNPLAQIQNTHNTTTTDKLLGNINAEIKFLKDFTFNMKLAVDYSLIYNNIFTPKYYYSEENLGINDTTNSNVRNTYQKLFRYTYENYFTYKKTFGDHSIEALAGFSYEKFTPSFLDVTSYGVPHNDVKYAYFYNTLNSSPTNIPLINGGLGTINVNDPAGAQIVNNYSEILNSYFGRISYNYKEKYLVQCNIRRDASSLFGPAFRSGVFPSFSLGWNISKENFFKDNISFINTLKLRFSWGQNGNKQVLSPFQYTSVMNTTGNYYADQNGNILSAAVPDNPGNPNLHWETSQQSDLGLEMMMLDNKISFGVDLFDKRTKDQLAQNALVPRYLGYNSIPFINSGEVQNKGVEFDLSYRKLEGDFKYTVSLNSSYLKNEVISYGSEGTFIDGIKIGTNDPVTRYEAGFPVYYFRGYKAIGIFQSKDDVNSYSYTNPITGKITPIQPKAIAGDVKYQDIDGDGKITPTDATNYLGKSMPDWTFGLNLYLEYKGFDLSAFAQGVTGNQLFFAVIRTDRLLYNKPEYYYTDAWKDANSTKLIPRASAGIGKYGYSMENYNWSNINVFKGDYLRLKNVTLGYTLPKQLTSKIGINKVRIYVSATNLLTLTKYPGTDPEIGQVVASDPSTNGVDRGLYPASRIFTTGINVTF
jgi:TonB-dependent starch-binding outer membrane protein SusC